MLYDIGMIKQKSLPYLKTVGERLAYARQHAKPGDKKLTQKDVAEKFGISGQAISEWERGGSPDLGKIVALAKLYRVPTEWLLSDVPLEEPELELLTLIAQVRNWKANRRDPMFQILLNRIKIDAPDPSADEILGEMDEPVL